MLIAITDILCISPNASLEMIQAIEAKLHEPDGDSRAKIDTFMRGQFQEAQKLQGPNPARPNFVLHDTTEPGGLFRKMGSVPIILGLVGMYGCTSILIMSKHAVWWSHFWENPWFVTNDAGTIRNTFLDRSILTDKIHLGQDVPRPFSANVLGLLNSNKNCQDKIPGLLCEIEAGKSFAADAGTRAFIITPRDSKSNILYNLHVEAIQGELEMVLPGLKPGDLQVITYLPSGSDTDFPEDGGNPKEYQSMYGKVLVQYDPQDTAATSRAGKAAIELLAE
jgi:hypothetical protein